jgi:HSP20 family protein
MNITLWKPKTLRTMYPSVFDELDDLSESGQRTFSPAVDILEKGQKIILKADLPGVTQKEIKVEVKDGILTISGERKFEEETSEDNSYRRETRYGSFCRSFSIEGIVDESKIDAHFRNGELTITLPKKKEVIEHSKAREIFIQGRNDS